MKITLEQAEEFVNAAHFVEWDGWTLNLFNDRYDGFYKQNGCWRNNQWQLKFRYEINDEGMYEIPARYARFIKSIGH